MNFLGATAGLSEIITELKAQVESLTARAETAEAALENEKRMEAIAGETAKGFLEQLTTLQSSLTQAEGERDRLRAVLQIDQPWALWHIINSLCDAVDFAFLQYDMRPDGWEAWSHNAKVGREIAANLEALSTTPPSVGREDSPAFFAFHDRENEEIILCYTPSSPDEHGVYATPYYAGKSPYEASSQPVQEGENFRLCKHGVTTEEYCPECANEPPSPPNPLLESPRIAQRAFVHTVSE